MNVRTRIALYSSLLGGSLFCLASALVANWNSPLVNPTPTPTCTASPPCTATPVPTCSVVRPTATGTPDVNSGCHTIPWPTTAPTITPIASNFQPPSGDAPLAWRPFEPTGSPTPAPPWPTILVIHGGGFKRGAPFPGYLSETVDIINTATDLANAGYYVLVVAYRLAPPNAIPGQTCGPHSGLDPWQEYDVEAMIEAAHADGRVGKIGVIGGSGGATHAIWAALDTRTDDANVWPFWRPAYRPTAAVGLSGAYDLSDRTPEDYCNGGDPVQVIKQVAENYTTTNDPVTQYNNSVVHLLDLPTFNPTQVKPMLIYNTQHDSMAYHQIIDLQCKLQEKDVNPALYTITTLTAESNCEQHAFGYWNDIKYTVIPFFDCQLKGENCASPTPLPHY
jgi:acetyl esterase/lipase